MVIVRFTDQWTMTARRAPSAPLHHCPAKLYLASLVQSSYSSVTHRSLPSIHLASPRVSTMNAPSSRLSGFHKQSVADRVARVAEFSGLDQADRDLLAGSGHLDLELANRLVENVVGTMNIPLGVATNLRIDGRDYLVPMATEESSVIAAVCNAARQCYDN